MPSVSAVCGKATLEELLVELGDDPLLALGVVDARGAHPDAGVELLERLGLGVDVMLVEHVEHPLHDS